ncbi:MAG: CalY family protein [Solirubrobacteraceae bacterium]|nr:CalY family protein [Solirubrobacteraceae bacterium]
MSSRLSALAGRPRQTLAALAVALAAVGVAVGSGANFTANVATVNNTFSSGTLTLAGPTAAILGADNMKPGNTRTGLADIENSGSVAGKISVTPKDPTGSLALLGELNLVIQDCGAFAGTTAPSCDLGDPAVYTGPVYDTSPATIELGEYQPAEKHRYKFTVSMPSTSDNTFQGLSGTLTFGWNAVTDPNTP